MATAGGPKQQLPIFRWDTLEVIGPHDLGYRPTVPGIMMEVTLTTGATVRVWRSADAQQYFCHGLTFGGKDAPGGPVSPYTGAPVETILREHYVSLSEAEARAGDILVWRGIEPETTPHSAVLTEVARLPDRGDLRESSRRVSKNGMLPEGVFTPRGAVGDLRRIIRGLPPGGYGIASGGAVVMNDVAATVSQARAAPAGIVCRLRKRARGRAAASPIAGEVELENVSGEVLEIEVQTSPLQYLDLLVTDAGGEPLSGWRYGESFSPLAAPYTLRLCPGEKYTAPVSLLGNVPAEKRLPGTYLIRAVYEYKQTKGVSEVFRLDYRPDRPAE